MDALIYFIEINPKSLFRKNKNRFKELIEILIKGMIPDFEQPPESWLKPNECLDTESLLKIWEGSEAGKKYEFLTFIFYYQIN